MHHTDYSLRYLYGAKVKICTAQIVLFTACTVLKQKYAPHRLFSLLPVRCTLLSNTIHVSKYDTRIKKIAQTYCLSDLQ